MPVEKIVVITLEALPVGRGKILIAQSSPVSCGPGIIFPLLSQILRTCLMVCLVPGAMPLAIVFRTLGAKDQKYYNKPVGLEY